MSATAPGLLDESPPRAAREKGAVGWLASVHGRLMPDYDRKVTWYWSLMVAIGVLVLAHAARFLSTASSETWLQIVAATAMAMLTGLVAVRVPRSTTSFTAGEIFIFLLLLIHGPEAACIAAAAESSVAAWRGSRRWTSRLASPAMSATAMFITGSLLQAVVQRFNSRGFVQDSVLLLSAIVFAIAYFVLNTFMVTTIPRLKRNEPFVARDFVASFGWLSIAYVGSGCVATLLYLSFRQSGFVVVVAAMPIIAILLTTGHYFFRREEANDAVRLAREVQLDQAARHTHELEVSERRFHSAFTHASIGMALVAFDGRIRQANAALRALLGLAAPDGDNDRLDFAQFFTTDGTSSLVEQLAKVQSGKVDALQLELRTRHRDGSEIWVDAHCAFFSEADSAETWLILQLQDITARRRAQADLHYIAFHDNLTGLPNRHRFHEHLARAISRARADPGHEFGVMFLDFDRFKLINDSMGHTMGDEFLIQVSRRIEENVRP
ncbi:MAG: diguanylate cyclase, partial [Pseudomonadota bacterium]|nr:diguanylate cyclase [Pseudomonadota bacterium]